MKKSLIFLIPLLLLSLTISSLFIFSKASPKIEQIEQKVSDLQQDIYQKKEEIRPKPSTIESTGLPSKHLIKTAFIPQAPEKNWDQPWQDACEEAGILTIYNYYHSLNPDLNQILSQYQELFDYENSQNWTHDINTQQMLQLAQDLYQLEGYIIKNPSLEQLKELLSQNIPILVPANGKTLYQENKHFNNGGPYYHNLVILGYDDHLSKFIVHDVGTQYGAYYQYSYQLLLDSIHDFPDSGIKSEINSSPKKVVVLLK